MAFEQMLSRTRRWSLGRHMDGNPYWGGSNVSVWGIAPITVELLLFG